MAAIRHTLQREVFSPHDERLHGVVHVSKFGRRRKVSLLCVSVTTEQPATVQIHQIKKAEKGDTYRKKTSWSLRELRCVDAKEADKGEFDLQFDKVYKWVASSLKEKDEFILSIVKICNRYLTRQKPQFLHIGPKLQEEVNRGMSISSSIPASENVINGGIAEEENEDSDGLPVSLQQGEEYQVILPNEATDLEGLMSECSTAISNAESFLERLQGDLGVLEEAQIHSLLASEAAVSDLMSLLDSALADATSIEENLDSYDRQLQTVRDYMEAMEERDGSLQTVNTNMESLMKTLQEMVDQLEFNKAHEIALTEGNLDKQDGIAKCSVAAVSLRAAMASTLHQGLGQMKAVKDQKKKLERLSETFQNRFVKYITSKFIQLGNELSVTGTLSYHAQELKMPTHRAAHKELLDYCDLTLWLKQANMKSFEGTYKVYISSMSKVYERQVSDFFERGKMSLGLGPAASSSGPASNRLAPATLARGLDGSSSSLNKMSPVSPTTASDAGGRAFGDPAGRGSFDRVLEKVLSELEPFCKQEQDFCTKFFHLNSPPEPIDVVENDVESMTMAKIVEFWQLKSNPVKRIMEALLPNLESELSGFLNQGHTIDGYNSLYALVRMSEHVTSAQSPQSGSFLGITFASCLIQAKRNFDQLVNLHLKSIEECRIAKNKRCGILPFVSSFEEFVSEAETIFKGSERKTDLDKAYTRIVDTIFNNILRCATEQQKNPKDVVMMENYHHMYDLLARFKIACLEEHRKTAKNKYSEHLNTYVTMQLGRPLEKLNYFFEGIEAKVAQGVKMEEIGYQMAFSRQELRKVIDEYSKKDVKKNIELLYKKVEKHLCEEENLNQTVWHSMQVEFLNQYKHFDELINRCYPGSAITLSFTIADLLEFFSDIARSQ